MTSTQPTGLTAGGFDSREQLSTEPHFLSSGLSATLSARLALSAGGLGQGGMRCNGRHLGFR